MDVAGARLTKTVRVTPLAVRLSPERSIRLSYPGRDIDVPGHGMHWMIPFFVLSIVFAFALRGLFKVTI